MVETYRDAEHFKQENGYSIDDLWYPRVTKVVSVKAKPALLYYYASARDYRSATAALEESAREGTLVHEAAEAILLGRSPEIPPLIEPAITAFREFLDRTPLSTKPEFIERRIVHKDHRYAGTVDALATIGDNFGVLDIKTSQAIYRDYGLQTAAYVEALRPEFPDLATRWILRIDQYATCDRCGATRRTKGRQTKIRRNGGSFTCAPTSHEFGPVKGSIELKEFPSWHSDFAAFLGAKRLWEWEHESWLSEIGYL